MSDLEVCPFCKNEVYIKRGEKLGAFICPTGSHCRVLRTTFKLEQEAVAIEAWNTRAGWISADDVKALIKQAYMVGQAEEGIDPSYSNAQIYCDRIMSSLPPAPEVIDEQKP